MAPHHVPALGPDFGHRAARLHQEHGVRLHLSTKVEQFEGTNTIEAVRLADGARIPACLPEGRDSRAVVPSSTGARMRRRT